MRFARATAEAKHQRKQAGEWLKGLRKEAGLSQVELATKLGFKYYTFVAQVENGFGRVPTEAMSGWAKAVGVEPSHFVRQLLQYYEPELFRLLFGNEK